MAPPTDTAALDRVRGVGAAEVVDDLRAWLDLPA